MSVRRRIAAVLEWERPMPGWLGLAGWRSPIRDVALPTGLAVVGVGGSTLGGSGRTPVAIALARALAGRGFRVAFVAHGFGGRSVGPRWVGLAERAGDVGDETTIAARALASTARVVVGRDRAASLAIAAASCDVAVVDRLLQAAPTPLACAVLALDARSPWGSGRLLPFGDLVAPPGALVDAADEVVHVGGPDATTRVRVDGEDGAATALVTSAGRPDRIAASLEAVGRRPLLHVKRGDHEAFTARELASLRRLAGERRIDAWLADAKTTAWLADAGALDALGAPVREIHHHIELASPLVDRIERRIRASIRRR